MDFYMAKWWFHIGCIHRRQLANCFADEGDRKERKLSEVWIFLSEQHRVSLLSDRSPLFPSLTVPSRKELSAPTPTTFPLCKLSLGRKAPRHVPINSVRPPVWIHTFFTPFSATSLPNSEKEDYFWCIELVFILLWWGNRKSSYPINLYNMLIHFILWQEVKLYKCMGNTGCEKK